MVLVPKKEMSLQEKLYYCMCIKTNAYRYSYGRQANKTLRDIELPDIVPNWAYSITVGPIKTLVNAKIIPTLKIENWREFKVGDLFNIINGIKYPADWREKGDLPLVSTSASNNGISDYITTRPEKYKNILTVAYSGSVGITFFHKNDVFVGETVFALIPKFDNNVYIAMFLCTIFNFHNKKYGYGRKIIGSRYIFDTIKLPAKGNTPNWTYMENYIKCLPYSDRISH